LGYENIEHDYPSHEKANNDGYDIAIDVWSLGILFLQLITGVPLLVGSA
jgi:serine/threonine protein kinase